MATILVTGGAGFIGSHVVDALLARGETVVCIDNLNDFYDPKIKIGHVAQHFSNPLFHFFVLDIKHKQKLHDIFNKFKFDTIIHLAARAGVRPSINDPLGYEETNVTGTLNLLQISKDEGVKRFIFASSSSVYGANQQVPFSEHHQTDRPLSPYAASKKACEVMCHTYSHLCDMSITCLRFFTVYGPRNRPDLMVSKFAEDILHNREITIFGTGDEVMRDWTYIDDIVRGILKTVDATQLNTYEILNLGNSHPVPVTYLVRLLEQELGQRAIVKRAPLPPGDVPRTYADTKKVELLLGWKPQVSFEQGIRQFVTWFLQQQRKEPTPQHSNQVSLGVLGR